MKYNTVKLGDYLYIKGRIGWKGLKKSEYLENSPFRIINGESLTEDGINWEKAGFISRERYDESPEIMLQKEDILISKDGTIGKIGYIQDLETPTTVASGIFVIRNLKPEIINTRFIYHFLTSKYFKNFILMRTEGSVIPHLYQKDFVDLDFPLPIIDVQNKIVGVLDAISSKIELNKRINNNLEQQVKALFKSWFIDFEPFGGEQPSEMQFIPLQNLCKVVTKGTTPTTLGKPFTTSGINFIKAESILDNHSIDTAKFAYIDEETNTMLKRSIMEPNDIVFTIAGTLGRFALVDESVLPANTNQAVAIIRPDTNKVAASYLYSFFIGNWHNDYYSRRVQQAVQANLSLTTIKSLPIAILSNNTMKKYDELVNPLFALMKSNEEENRKLSILRDTLLPKLMSAELDLSEVEI